jgi:hypothetical protein
MVEMRAFRPLALLLPLLLAGCRGPADTRVRLAPGVTVRLCLPETGPDLFITQEMVMTFPGGRQETAIAAIENRGGVMSLVASTPLGQTLFVVQSRGGAVTVDTRVPLPAGIDPRALAALVQFALWPAEALRASLGPGVQLELDGARRTLLRRGRVVWTVTREGETQVLENPALGLTVRVRTLED